MSGTSGNEPDFLMMVSCAVRIATYRIPARPESEPRLRSGNGAKINAGSGSFRFWETTRLNVAYALHTDENARDVPDRPAFPHASCVV